MPAPDGLVNDPITATEPTLSTTPLDPASSRDVVSRERTERVEITFESVVVGDVADALWEAYRANFEPLEELAILQHMFEREQVLAEFADPTITKIVGWDGETPVGLGMVTKNLEAVPQISPRYLRAKYPEHAAHDRIYFGILVAVSPDHRGMTLFQRLYLEMWNMPAREGGVLIFDICEFNRVAFDTDALAQRIGGNFPGSAVETIDRQTYYAAELPNPIPGS